MSYVLTCDQRCTAVGRRSRWRRTNRVGTALAYIPDPIVIAVELLGICDVPTVVLPELRSHQRYPDPRQSRAQRPELLEIVMFVPPCTKILWGNGLFVKLLPSIFTSDGPE